MFVVGCSVSGGVTGHRVSVVKDVDGKVKRFKTREEAQAEADRNTEDTRGNNRVSFRYWVDKG